MNGPSLSSETVRGTCVAIGERAVLLSGRSGSGKSDLALRLIDRGATLISDDYTLLRRSGGKLLASAPSTIGGRLEVRGIGIVELPVRTDMPVALIVSLDETVPRLPEEPLPTRLIAGLALPVLALAAPEPSAPLKVERALARFGVPVAS